MINNFNYTCKMVERKAKLLVFDLDYTLWPFWVDTHVNPPFKKKSNGIIEDSHGHKIDCYPGVPGVLKKLYDEGYTLGVASRTSEIKGAKQLIQLFGWDKYFTYKEIFPGCKVTHFNNIKKTSGIDFSEMIFFDDEDRNIRDLKQHGVLSILVRNGVSQKVVDDALKEFSKQKS